MLIRLHSELKREAAANPFVTAFSIDRMTVSGLRHPEELLAFATTGEATFEPRDVLVVAICSGVKLIALPHRSSRRHPSSTV